MLKIQKTQDGLDTFYSTEYNQTYHSKHGVLQEARYVFLDGSGISQKIISGNKVAILEIGFGTGFNFFLTADLAIKNKTTLIYYAVEKNLPNYKDYIRLNHNTHFSTNYAWLNFLSWRRHSSMLKNGVYKIVHRNINLYLILSDAIDMKLPENFFDAVYQDAFSPTVNPELWTVSFFKKILHVMNPGAKLSTYSAKGDVKRALQEAGYLVNKLPGPKGKREMLVASRSF